MEGLSELEACIFNISLKLIFPAFTMKDFAGFSTSKKKVIFSKIRLVEKSKFTMLSI